MTSYGAIRRHQSVATGYEYPRGVCPTGEKRMFALRLSGVHSPAAVAIYSLNRLKDLQVLLICLSTTAVGINNFI